MLPDPKKVAGFLKKTFFQSAEERRQEEELNREVKVRLGKAHLRRHLAHQKDMLNRLTALAKRALTLNDEPRFRQVGRQLLWTKKDIQRWEQYLLTLEVLEARRDQAKASVELVQSVKAMSESLADLSSPQQIGDLQRQLEEGLARASGLEERMEVMMEVMDSALSADMPVDEESLSVLETGLIDEITSQEAAAFDREIEDGLQKIRSELEKQEK
jgi:hypothetical protein